MLKVLCLVEAFYKKLRLNLQLNVRLTLWPKRTIVLSVFLSLLLSSSLTAAAQQHSAELFPMVNGTQVQILSSNLLTVITSGQIIEGRLELHAKLTPTQDVQLIFSNAQTGEVGILPAIVSFEGNDLLIPINNQTSNSSRQAGTQSYLSLHNWLLTTKGVALTTASDNQY